LIEKDALLTNYLQLKIANFIENCPKACYQIVLSLSLNFFRKNSPLQENIASSMNYSVGED